MAVNCCILSDVRPLTGLENRRDTEAEVVPCALSETHDESGCLVQDGVVRCFIVVVPKYRARARDTKAK
jgi:hypothetical protein